MIEISVIIVNYNTAPFIEACIFSVLEQKNVNYEIIVIDNASQDDSMTMLEQFANKIKVIANKENVGFGKANNQVFHESLGEYTFLLNPDAYLQNSDDLRKILTFAREHAEYGLIGTKILNEEGDIETKPRKLYPGEKHIESPYKNLPGEIAWLLGASMIISRGVYQKTNGFDEGFFLYGEDADLCLRIRKAGYAIGYFEEVAIKHVGKASESKTNPYDLTIKKQKALRIFYNKHYEPGMVKKLIKEESSQAFLRMCLHKVLSIFVKRDYHTRKYIHYKAIYDLQIKDKSR